MYTNKVGFYFTRHITSLLLMGLCFYFPIRSAQAIPEKPSAALDTVQGIINRAKSLENKSLYSENTKSIEDKVDFDRLSLEALGPSRSRISSSQRSEIQNLLKKIITKTVYPAAPQFFKEVTIDFTGEEQTKRGIHISSTVTKGSKRSSVEYWLSPDNRVIDISIDGESWTENLRSQFDEIISRKGASDLISRMKRRLRELEGKRG